MTVMDKVGFDNNCVHREKDGYCSKTLCYCPKYVTTNVNGDNNLVCDGASFIPKGKTTK